MSADRFRYWGLKALSIWGVILAAFLLPHLLPDTPLSLYESWPSEPSQRDDLIAAYGFDRSLPVQYVIWIQRLATGQWGQSRFYHRPVFDDILRASGFTALFIIWSVIAYGLWRVAFKGLHRLLHRLGIRVLLLRGRHLTFLEAIPTFLIAIIINDIAVWQLGWTRFTNVVLFAPYHYLNPLIMLLPASALALTSLVVWHTRGQPVPCGAGTSNWRQWCQHSRYLGSLLRPLLGYLFMEILLIEYVFSLPGLGSFGIRSLRRRDIPAIQGFILGVGALYILIALILDRAKPGRRRHETPRRQPTPQIAMTSPTRQAVYSGVWCLIVLIALAAWAPRLWLYDPTEIHTYDQLLLPNSRYILGTDFLGRDILSRTVEGFRSSIPRIGLSIVLIGLASSLCLGLKHVLPSFFKKIWSNALVLFEALPPFVLALLTFIVVEHRTWPLEIALTMACLPLACKTAMSPGSLFQRLATLAYLAELMLLLDVNFFYLNITPEPPDPTWGGDLRIAGNYSHLNIWLLLAPVLAVTWSRYMLHKLGMHSPLVGTYEPFSAERD